MDSKACLYLVPVPLGEEASSGYVSDSLLNLINRLKLYVVENERTARRHLRKMGFTGKFEEIEMLVLDEHSTSQQLAEILKAVVLAGEAGLMSEAGVPGIADPGEDLVWEAHRLGLIIFPIPGPSSILLALMASGLNGERFAFHGYLPVKPEQRKKELKFLEQRTRSGEGAQLFIETPYRSQTMLDDILQVISSNIRLCVASNLGLADENICSMHVSEWKKKPLALDKRLCIFILDN
jgi:16S rRNA (cytidine1402-2'-O)-methyltransferase